MRREKLGGVVHDQFAATRRSGRTRGVSLGRLRSPSSGLDESDSTAAGRRVSLTSIPAVLNTVGMRTGLTQPQRKERTRRSLVETARRVFGERGFHGASLEEIADAAGYSKGAVY